MNAKLTNIIDHTNARLANWYANVKRDYDVIGEGYAGINGDHFTIDYTEDGVLKKWQMKYCEDDLRFTPIDFFFNIWMEEAN